MFDLICVLLVFVLPVCALVFSHCIVLNDADYHNSIMIIGGKIKRKYYLINSIVSVVVLIIGCVMLAIGNRFFMVFSIPFLLLGSFLLWNNRYKRLYDILDMHKISFYVIIIMVVLFLIGIPIDKYFCSGFKNVSRGLISLFDILLLLIPSKNIKKEDV